MPQFPALHKMHCFDGEEAAPLLRLILEPTGLLCRTQLIFEGRRSTRAGIRVFKEEIVPQVPSLHPVADDRSRVDHAHGPRSRSHSFNPWEMVLERRDQYSVQQFH